MRLHLNIAAVLLLLASVSQAQVPALTKEEIIAVKSLAADVLQQVKTLERDIKIFSWTDCQALPKLTNINERSADALRLLSQQAAKAWDFTKVKDGAVLASGEGVYAARDPFTSSYFGDCLMEISIPKGSKYLDTSVSTLGTIKVSESTITKLKAAGCDRKSNEQFFHQKMLEEKTVNYVNYRFAVDSVPCNKMMMTALKALDVIMIDHVWLSAHTLRDCKNGRGGTFTLIQTDGMKASNVTVYSNLIAETTEAERDLGRKRMLQRDEFSYDNTPEQQKELDEWKAKYIFKCGDFKNDEDLLEIDNLSPSKAQIEEVSNKVDALFTIKEMPSLESVPPVVDEQASIKIVPAPTTTKDGKKNKRKESKIKTD